MFSLVKGFLDMYFEVSSYKMLIIGEESSGKTTYFEKIKEFYLGKKTPSNLIIPTSGLNYTNITIWDLGGKKELRSMWDIYYSDIDSLVFMIDNTKSIDIQLKIFHTILENKYIKKNDLSILILINKIDISAFNEFNELYNKLNFETLSNKKFNILTISALKGIGIKESINWIYNSITSSSNKFDNISNIV